MRIFVKLILCITSLAFVSNMNAVEISPDNIDYKKKLTASGGLSFNNTFYAGSDSLIKRDPYVYTLCGTLNLNYMGVDLPFSFAVSNTSKE